MSNFSGERDDAELLVLLYLGVADDLCTQCLSRQQRADGTLEAGSHILIEITAGISRYLRDTRRWLWAAITLGRWAVLVPFWLIYESSLRAGHGWRESLCRHQGWFKSF